MDFTERDAALRAVTAERFGETAVPDHPTTSTDNAAGNIEQRERFLLTLRNIYEWIDKHPEWPVPFTVTMTSQVTELEALQLAKRHAVLPLGGVGAAAVVDFPTPGVHVAMYAIPLPNGAPW